MDLLESKFVNISKTENGISFNLSLYTKGSKPDWRADFPREYVRLVGVKIRITNNTDSNLKFGNFLLGIKVQDAYQKFYTLNESDKKLPIVLSPLQTFSASFNADCIEAIFNDFKEEKGIIIVYNNTDIYHSDFFNGESIEKSIKALKLGEEKEYMNWGTKEFSIIVEEKKEKLLSKIIKKITSNIK